MIFNNFVAFTKYNLSKLENSKNKLGTKVSRISTNLPVDPGRSLGRSWSIYVMGEGEPLFYIAWSSVKPSVSHTERYVWKIF